MPNKSNETELNNHKLEKLDKKDVEAEDNVKAESDNSTITASETKINQKIDNGDKYTMNMAFKELRGHTLGKFEIMT